MQKSILKLLYVSWTLYPNDPAFASKIPPFFPPIIDSYYDSGDNDNSDTGVEQKKLDPAFILGRELLPYLPPEVVMKTLAPAILNAAAKQLQMKNVDAALVLLQSVANVRPLSSTVSKSLENSKMDLNQITNDLDEMCPLFFVKYARKCIISQSSRDKLIDLCLSDDLKDTLDEGNKHIDYASIGFAIRCIPFLVFVSCGDHISRPKPNDNKVLQWFGALLKNLDKHNLTEEEHDQYVITKALSI